jgi:sulfate transport system permease protein
MTIELDRKTPAPEPAGATGTRRSRRVRHRPGLPLSSVSGPTLGVVVIWLSLLVLLPLAAVVGKAFDGGWSDFASAVTARDAAAALRLTILLALGVAVVSAVMGTLVAWVLVREPFRGSRLLELVIDIPFALPTIVAGLVMLAVYGGDTPFAPNLFGTRAGLFVALLFVTLPFGVRTVQPVLGELDREVEQAAASLGASPTAVFRRIVAPQILPAVASGAALAFARALGEYGSLILISSNIPFKTQIASSLIYGKLQDAENAARSTQQAAAISTVLLLASALVLVLIEVLQRQVKRRG